MRQEYLPPSYEPSDPFSCRRAQKALAAAHAAEVAALFWNCDEYRGALREVYERNVDLPVRYLSLAEFKRLCGAGGTVRDRAIEIQGDHRERLAERLRTLGYRVKLAGG